MTSETVTCPGGCAAVDACGCYVEGYNQGKDKAHFELRNHAGSSHDFLTCGCEPCITVRQVIDTFVSEAVYRSILTQTAQGEALP